MKTLKYNLIHKTILILIGLLLPLVSFTQIKHSNKAASTIKISGTSSLHDWQMVSSENKSNVDIELDKNNNIVQLQGILFSMEVKSLKSDNKRLDENAYKALKASEHHEIIFKSISTKISRNNSNHTILKINGQLTVAGVTKNKNIEAVCVKTENNKLICSGETKLKMTDFSVVPPSFMFGAMTTGDEITISFNTIYEPNKL